MIRDGQRRAEWVEKILPYAREHGAEVSTFSLSFSNQRSQTNIISLKHDSEHKISSLSPDLRSSGNMLGRIHGSQTLFLWRVQSRREDWVFLKCKCTSSTTNNKWHFLSLLLLQRIHRRQAFHEMTLYFILLRQALLSTLPPPLWPRSWCKRSCTRWALSHYLVVEMFILCSIVEAPL